MTTDNYGSTMDPQFPDQQSLIGPPASHSDDPNNQQTSMVGPPAAHNDTNAPTFPQLTPEEQEAVKGQLLQKKELGLYTNATLLAGVTDPEDANRQNPVKSKSGVWLQPGDPDYIAARDAIEKQGLPHNVAPPPEENIVLANATTPTDPALDQKTHKDAKDQESEVQERNLRQETVDHINHMVAVNTGSVDPHMKIDQAALQTLRQGASTQSLKDLQGRLAAVNGFALVGQVEDVNEDRLNEIKADGRVTGPGADKAYAQAQERKEKANQQFTALLRKKQLGEPGQG